MQQTERPVRLDPPLFLACALLRSVVAKVPVASQVVPRSVLFVERTDEVIRQAMAVCWRESKSRQESSPRAVL